jgi:tetratricopeptide (TPR) repeat protein
MICKLLTLRGCTARLAANRAATVRERFAGGSKSSRRAKKPRSSNTGGSACLSGFLLLLSLSSPSFAQTGVFQTTNPNYPNRNPFYFEGKVDYEKLSIASPGNAWEYAQRGIHRQDDLEDIPGAMADYRESLSLNSLSDGSCQIVTSVPAPDFGKLDPPPCMFTVRLRLGYLLMRDSPEEALTLFQEVLRIDPQRLEVNSLMGDANATSAGRARTGSERRRLYSQSIAAYQAELALSPVTQQTIALTGDEANNAHAHWALAGIYEKLEDPASAIAEYELYLKATKWHSDVYPWRIPIAQKKIAQLQATLPE